jgi:hypothetical protein
LRSREENAAGLVLEFSLAQGVYGLVLEFSLAQSVYAWVEVRRVFSFEPHLWGFRWSWPLGVAEADSRSPLKRADWFSPLANPGVNAWATEKGFSAGLRKRVSQQGYGKGFLSRATEKGFSAGLRKRVFQQGYGKGFLSRATEKGFSAGLRKRVSQQGYGKGFFSRATEKGFSAGLRKRVSQQPARTVQVHHLQ